jgi:hypothetical protein
MPMTPIAQTNSVPPPAAAVQPTQPTNQPAISSIQPANPAALPPQAAVQPAPPAAAAPTPSEIATPLPFDRSAGRRKEGIIMAGAVAGLFIVTVAITYFLLRRSRHNSTSLITESLKKR